MLELKDVLEGKEARANRRNELIARSNKPVISLTMNMPGSVKDSPIIRQIFKQGISKIEEQLMITSCQIFYDKIGPQALFSVAAEPVHIKHIACQIEQGESWSRLWDIDVYDLKGATVASETRQQGRSCFLCENLATVCMRENRHSLEEILKKVEHLFTNFLAENTRCLSKEAETIGALALESLLYEVACTPSPGLVDRSNSGSHKDMDFFHFQRSSAALGFTLARCAQAGLNHEGDPMELLPVLRRIGCEGEARMFAATEGVNTQKGLLFSMGLAVGAAGILSRLGSMEPESICEIVKQMAKGLVERELGALGREPQTAGEMIYRDFGISGIRGEVEAGFPSILEVGLPTLQSTLSSGMSINQALLGTLLALMGRVSDTTILHREPTLEALLWIQKEAENFDQQGGIAGVTWEQDLQGMDERFIARNLSPGGSADLLAVTWFLHRLKENK